jgi:hypothetical protein
MDAGSPHAFTLGVNYPWVNYGQDFGRSPWGHTGVSSEATRQIVAEDFRQLGLSGVKVVRWFLLCDGRSGLQLSNGVPAGPDDLLLEDVSAALDLAKKNNLQLWFSLSDFLWMQNPSKSSLPPLPSQNVMKFAAGREALLECVLAPLFQNFSQHPSLFAWEIANEPEWAIPEFTPGPQAGVSLSDFRAFAVEVAESAHQYPGTQVTLGSARLSWVRAWTELGLDFHQAHYYPAAERNEKLSLREQLDSLKDVEQPLWLGELPSKDPSFPDYSLEQSLNVCRRNGLAGACIWRFRAPAPGGPDAAFGAADLGFLSAWLSQADEFRV